MSACDVAAGLLGNFQAAAEHLGGQIHAEHVARPAEQVEGDEWLAADRIDVGERVRRGDPAERARVVDNRGEEVCRRDDRPGGADPHHGRVVAVLDPDQEIVRPVLGHQPGHRLLKLARRYLARAAAAVCVLSEPDWLLSLHF